jgi:hypothetical protein
MIEPLILLGVAGKKKKKRERERKEKRKRKRKRKKKERILGMVHQVLGGDRNDG